jgi:hypothetical protein
MSSRSAKFEHMALLTIVPSSRATRVDPLAALRDS